MNITDIDRMLSLTDEKYLDDILDDDVIMRPRIRSYVTFGAAAAVIAVTVSCALSLGKTGSGTVGDVSPMILETISEESENTALTEPTEIFTENIMPSAEAVVNATEIQGGVFQDDPKISSVGTDMNIIENYYVFRDKYTRSMLPFDTSGFGQTNTKIYRDNGSELLSAEIALYTDMDDPANVDRPYVRIRISETGYYGDYHDIYAIENIPQDINGTAVYTLFHADEKNYPQSVYFEKDGYYYSCDFESLDRDDSDVITGSIIENGLRLSDFEREKADGAYLTVNKQMTLYEANRVHEFAGLVPQLTELIPVSTVKEKYHLGEAGAEYAEMTENGEPYYKELRLDYFSEFADTENSHAITLEYHWDSYEAGGVYSKIIKLSDVKFDALDGLGEETDEDGYYLYRFSMTFGSDRYISVNALCRKEQLQTALEAMYAKYTTAQIKEMYKDGIPDLPGNTLGQGLPRLSSEDVRALAEKGVSLDWSDFEEYECYGDVGSGMYALLYYLDDENYYLTLSGIPGTKPESISLTRQKPYLSADIRTADINEFFSEE